MRRLSTKLALALAMMLSIFYGCKNDDDGPDLIPPTINTPNDAAVAVDATTTLSFSVTTGGGYASASVASDPESIATAALTTEPADDSPNGTVVVTVTGVAAGEATVTLTVTDNENQNATRNVTVTVTETAPPTTDAPPTAGDSLSNIGELTTLTAAIDAVGLTDTLNNLDKVTIFAPNNAAFTELLTEFSLVDGDLDGLVAALTADSVSSVLQAHIVPDSLRAADLADGTTLTTLNNKTITIANDGTNVFANGAQVVNPDIIVGNGVIHIIDSVINLVEVEASTVVDSVVARDELSSLEAALTAAGLVDDLQGDGPFTVFAPNNAAFTALLEAQEVETLDALVEKIGVPALVGILQAHVIPQRLLSTDLEAQDYATLNGGETLTVTIEGETVLVDGAAVVTANIEADNGVVHIIDAVGNTTAPPSAPLSTVADTIASNDDLNSLEAALTTAGLVDDLQGDGPFTVFAPNNAAFADLLAAQEVANLTALVDKIGLPALTGILQAHVVLQKLMSTDLQEQDYATLNSEETLTVTKADGKVFVNGAEVLTADIEGSNGVVHIIDSVVNLPMAPPTGAAATVVDTIASRDDLEVLEAALTQASLIEPLQGDGPFTVFAPNNDAFTTLLQAEGVTSLEELIAKLGAPAVSQILQAHVVSNEAVAQTSDLLIDEKVYISMDGATLTITVQGGETYVNDALISETDLTTGNGVVHIIDEVVNTAAGSTGDMGFTVTIENESSAQRYFQNGVFNTPDGATDPGSIADGQSYTFTFNAGPNIIAGDGGTKLSFATMLMPSNDLFLASDPNGIPLYDGSGQAISTLGPVDVTAQVKVWDASTKDNATGEDDPTPGPVAQESDATGLATVTISNTGTEFTVTVTNVSTDNTFSPGVYGVHTEATPIFATDRGAGTDGLKALAETGDPTQLNTTMNNNEGFAVPLSPGVFAIHGTGVTPILVPDQADFGQGLESLAEDGDTTALAASLRANASVDSVGSFDGIAPGGSVSFIILDAEAGDILSLATMMVQSNDIVYSTSQLGIPLFDGGGQPTTGNVTPQVFAYDVGTELNEYPGAGLNQPIRQAAANTGAVDTNNLVRRVTNNDVDPSDDGFIYRPVNQRIKVTITPN